MATKIFLLDTNVLIHDPRALYAFKEASVGIPAVVLEELDSFKREGTDRGRSARRVIRELDELRSRGSLGAGVVLDNGSTIRVIFASAEFARSLPFSLDVEDNKILCAALSLQQQGYEVDLISKDLNIRVKADALGLAAHDYVHDRVNEQEFYRGWVRIAVSAAQLKKDDPIELREAIEQYQLARNQFVWLESQHNPHNYRVFRYLGKEVFIDVVDPVFRWPFKARNPQQLMALNALLDPAIQLVTLFGPAGTGKTFLALLAGLHKVLVEDVFKKILVARPVIPLGKDIGYLPGTLEEKLYTWMLPVYDNMEFIFHTSDANNNGEHSEHKSRHDKRQERRERRSFKHHRHRERHADHYEEPGRIHAASALDDMIRSGKISLEAITYMRGRSIPYQYIFIDEVQNLTPHEVKTLVSRVGQGSKIILAGDPYQIDTPYLDFSSNGLVVTSEKFKGQELFCSVYLEHSERSLLSYLAAELL